MTEIDAHRSRIKALLRLGDDSSVTEVEPSPLPSEIGALDGIGYEWPDEWAAVNVYVFDDYDEANDAEVALLRAVDRQTVTVESTVNGSLFLWAVAPSDQPSAVDRIRGLAGSFAGRE